MALEATHNELSRADTIDLNEPVVLLSNTLVDPPSSVLDPDFDSSLLPDLQQDSLKLSPADDIQTGFDWKHVDQAIDLLGEVDNVLIEDKISKNIVELRGFESANSDDLTGLVVSTDIDDEHLSLLESNLSPLLQSSFKSDQLLNRIDNSELLSLLSEESFSSGTGVGEGTHSPEIPVHVEQRYTLFEDDPFSISIQDLFPLSAEIEQYSLQLDAESGHDWLDLDQIQPDSTLVERLVIEALYRDEHNKIIEPHYLPDLSPGTLFNVDLVVTDTRADGLGLTGLELDLAWSPEAALLQHQDVIIHEELPLFRDLGELDALSGELTGLSGASLPSSGTGAALGDNRQDLFATLPFLVGDESADAFNLTISPVLTATSRNQDLEFSDVLTIGSNPDPITAIYGLADQNLVGSHQLFVEALDQVGTSWTESLILDIVNVNDSPSAIDIPPLTRLEDQVLSLDLHDYFEDVDAEFGDELTFHLRDVQPEWIDIDTSSGQLRGLPDQAQVGHWSLLVEATDRHGLSAEQWIDFTIENVNDAPYWTGIKLPVLIVREDQPFSLDLLDGLFVDQDGDQLTFGSQSNDDYDWLSIDSFNGTLTGLAPEASSDIYDITVFASDPMGKDAIASIQLQVVDESFNRAPYLSGPHAQEMRIDEGQPIRFDLHEYFADDDIWIGDKLNFDVQAPSWLHYDPATGLVSGTPSNSDVGSHPVRFHAIDSNEIQPSEVFFNFILDVTNINQAPNLLRPARESRLLEAGETFKFNLSSIFSDVDQLHGDSLSYSLRATDSSSQGLPKWLSWNSKNGELILSPGADDRGLLTLDFIASDRSGLNLEYQLNLGIVSDDGLVEVNKALQNLYLNQGEKSVVDLQDAFIQLRDSSNLDYSYELLRRNSNGIMTPLSADESEWVTIVDRRSTYLEREEKVTIEPIISLLETGEILSLNQLKNLEAGTELNVHVNISDLRTSAEVPGLIGLDMGLSWNGLKLSSQNPVDLVDAISDSLPLYRSVTSLSPEDNSLRLSAASLPSLGIGDLLGDQLDEAFVTLGFTLEDPSEDIMIDLKLFDEEIGGLGYGLADESNDDSLLNLVDISSLPLPEIHIDTAEQDLGIYSLAVSAANSDDFVSQSFTFAIGDEQNAPPELRMQPSLIAPYDNYLHRLDLGLLFDDSDGDDISYTCTVASDNQEHQKILEDSVYLVYSNGIADLQFDVPGLSNVVEGSVTITASDGMESVEHSVQVRLDPRAQIAPLIPEPEPLSLDPTHSVGLADLFSIQTVLFPDSQDEVGLAIRSDNPVQLQLTREFQDIVGLSDEEFTFLQASIFGEPGSNELTDQLIIPISGLSGLIPDSSDGFDLNWIALEASDQHDQSTNISVSTISRVSGDLDGSTFGLSQSDWRQASLSISDGLISNASSAASDLVLSNSSALSSTANARISYEDDSDEFNVDPYNPTLISVDSVSSIDQLSGQPNALSESVSETSQVSNESPLSFAQSSNVRSDVSTKTSRSPIQVLNSSLSSDKSQSDSIIDTPSQSSTSSRISASGASAKETDISSDLDSFDSEISNLSGVRTSSKGDLLFFGEPGSITNNPIVSMFNRLIDNPESPFSFVALLVGTVALPATVDRGLRSILTSGIARPLSPQNRNNALEAEWPLHLSGLNGEHLDFLVRLSNGHLTLSPLASNSSSSNTPLITDRSSAPSFDSELWQLLKVQENPGEFLSDIRIYLDQLLSRSLEESDIPWIEWYDSKLRSCSKSLDFNTHDKLMHFRRDLLAAASVDLSFADSMMLMQILDCNFKMGMKLPRVRT